MSPVNCIVWPLTMSLILVPFKEVKSEIIPNEKLGKVLSVKESIEFWVNRNGV
jgi:hypothetical protein